MLKPLYKIFADRLAQKGEKKKALKWYRKAKQPERTGDMLSELGSYSEAMQQYDLAKNYEKAAQAALQAGQNHAALEFFRKTDDPENAAEKLINAGDIPSAIELMCEKNLKTEAAEMLEAMGNISPAARLYLELGNYDKAIALFRESQNWDQLVAAYKARGDLENAAKECMLNEEFNVAATLYSENGQFCQAAEIYRKLGEVDKALDLFEKASDYESLAQLHLEAGRLDLAANAYEHIPGMDRKAAEIYEKLVILEEVDAKDFEQNIQCGMVAPDGNSVVLCKVNRAITLVNQDLAPQWRFLVSGEGNPRAIALTQDGKHIAIGSEGSSLGKDNYLMLLSNKKELLWEKQVLHPVKSVQFLSDDSALVAAIGDELYCFSLAGEKQWVRSVDFKPWTIDLSPKGDLLLVGTMAGTVFLFDFQGEEKAHHCFEERIHSAQFTPDGLHFIAACGAKNVILSSLEFSVVWQMESQEQVRMVRLYPGREVLVLNGNKELSLVNLQGARLYTHKFDHRIMACFTAEKQRLLYVALEDKTLHRYTSLDCKIKAAECYSKAGDKQKAAEIYRSIERYDEAYELFKQVGDFENAASTLHLTGDIMTAARHYEVIGKYEKAATMYMEIGEKNLAAKCFGKAGMNAKAAELFEELKDYILAADFYEREELFKKAGDLFASVDQSDRAIMNYESYLKENPDDKETLFDLAKFYQDAERYDEAIKMFQQVTDAEEYRYESLKKLGQCFLARNIYDVALDRFNECLGDDAKPNRQNIDVYYDIGRTYQAKGDYDNAKNVFGKVMAIDYYYRDIQERLQTSEKLAALETADMKTVLPAGMAETIPPKDVSIQPHMRYKIVKKLGEGGMGVVYLANDTQLNREVAWKVLPPSLALDENIKKRMLIEARAAAQLSNPYIISIYDIIMTENECSIIMEYIDGSSLRVILHEESRQPVGHVIHYATQISKALETAHQAGVIHRDLKPENIMIASRQDQVKVVDFGLARLQDDVHMTKEGCVLGTIPYMAPEQIMAREIGPFTDIYALGVMLFEMLAGRTPYIGENVLAQHLHNTPPDLLEFRQDIPKPFLELIYSCLEKDPKDRPESSSEIITQLNGIS